jgi:hypothetical protein
MNKLSYLFVLFLISFFSAKADNPQYAVSQIPKELLNNAAAVLRVDENYYNIISSSKATYKNKYAITIFKESANKYAVLYIGYDKLEIIESIKGTLFDANGKEIRKLKKSEIIDQSAISDYSIMEDSRVKIADMTYGQLPYTVEFEYETTSNGIMGYQPWYPQSAGNIAVESSLHQVSVPKGQKLRYKEINLFDQLVLASEQGSQANESSLSSFVKFKGKETNGDRDVYKWEAKHLSTIMPEAFSGKAKIAKVLFSPDDFEYASYAGKMSTWDDYGKWQLKLNAGRNDLPESTKQKIKDLTKNIPDKVGKIKAVYEYLQNKTRYVSIQLGIGGWQPFKSSFVDEKSYGDCKALSFYTQSMLEAIGIPSLYTIIGADENAREVLPDFPANYFNHIILCVPVEKDTIWLECTNQKQAFGYLGDFTHNRYALAVTPQGGKLVRTPKYGYQQNIESRKGEVKINADGLALVEVSTDYQALKEGSRYYYAEKGKEDQKKYLYEKINLPSFELLDFDLSRQKLRLPITTEKLSLKVTKWGSKSGKRMFITPNMFSQWTEIPAKSDFRKSPIVLDSDYDFTEKDELVFQLPEGYQLEYKPKDIKIESKFGEYQVSYLIEGQKLIFKRDFILKGGTYPKENYNDWIEFCKNVAKADKERIVLVNQAP